MNDSCVCHIKGDPCLYCKCHNSEINKQGKLVATCWSCNKVEDISGLSANLTGKRCECGGYIITPSGKIKAIWLGETV